MQSILNVVSRKLQTAQKGNKEPPELYYLLFCSSLDQKFLTHICVKDQVLAGLYSSRGESIFMTFPAQSLFSIFKSRLSSFHIISSNLFCTTTYPFDFLLPSTFKNICDHSELNQVSRIISPLQSPKFNRICKTLLTMYCHTVIALGGEDIKDQTTLRDVGIILPNTKSRLPWSKKSTTNSSVKLLVQFRFIGTIKVA